MGILDFLGFGSQETEQAAVGETETVRKIVEQLDHLEPQRARFIAAFAYVMSRVAGADMHISDDETRAMDRIVSEHGGLPEEQAIIVVQMAKTQHLLFGGTENYLVVRELNRIATREQKLALVDCLFAVSASDRSVSTVESNAIRQIADELKLDHADYIEVKSRYREHLSVLRPEREGD